jgi:hypothetical protein
MVLQRFHQNRGHSGRFFLPQKNAKIAEGFGMDLHSLSSLRSFAAIGLFEML